VDLRHRSRRAFFVTRHQRDCWFKFEREEIEDGEAFNATARIAVTEFQMTPQQQSGGMRSRRSKRQYFSAAHAS
jgi:hypothetical protein